ncbi:6-pyruvoyl tetrahydropterin synthase and hypothetical protein [Methanosalsum zhilinae DSM 4017]|uniref:6-pyruvoyltetrahydropterin synthase n=1 Tax=Methanosalsum zhilinae (strain DSM 4017 / NBRC 107636 / OCM 62 / WeN5) TaxID=679901 RepID=F7XPI2_METZD|nr:6-carboxytetrahydropterin synthase QueD [Methanosalsum zhilinae]AEH61407.1 6-pyruvoyl tetrahydropterin synthase and hypothetical protein [Methanosalsum zhilinae DSM 4017]
MSKMKLGIIEHIDSAHYLPAHDSCGIVHGHTYRVEVVIEGEKKESGMVMDFYDMKKKIKDILSTYDHVLLNDILDYPSAENICEHIHSKLSNELGYPLSVKVWEGHNKWCELSSIE